VKVTDHLLSTDFGSKLKEKGICYIRCLTDRDAVPPEEQAGVYNTWQRSFGVETKEEVEQLAKQKGLQIAWGPGRYLRTKFYTSAFEYCPAIKRTVLYSSIADDGAWFDTWPGVMELPPLETYDEATPSQRPLKITFGDDTPFTHDELQQFVDIYDQFGFPIEWKVGDVAVVCNYRFAHGRPGYSLEADEERTLGVILGPMFDRQCTIDRKWID